MQLDGRDDPLLFPFSTNNSATVKTVSTEHAEEIWQATVHWF